MRVIYKEALDRLATKVTRFQVEIQGRVYTLTEQDGGLHVHADRIEYGPPGGSKSAKLIMEPGARNSVTLKAEGV